MGPDAAPAAPELGALLSDRAAPVRARAAWALGALGPAAHSEVGPLSTALRDEDWNVRYHAAQALGSFGREAFPVHESVAHLSRHDLDSRVRTVATAAHTQIMDDWYRYQAKMRH